jgi:hypothetical protein
MPKKYNHNFLKIGNIISVSIFYLNKEYGIYITIKNKQSNMSSLRKLVELKHDMIKQLNTI